MPSLSMLIKPASGLCNMRCRYCFYADVAEHREVPSYGVMKSGTAEALVKRAFEYATGAVTFAFQGGEPTLAGTDFYRDFICFVNRYNTKNIPVSYAMQTNAYHFPEGLLELLRDNRFLLGVSLDGTAALHDMNRVDATGDGTFKRVSENIKKLDEYKIDYNILNVLTENNAKNIGKIYSFFRSKNYKYLQFIKHVDGFGDTEGKSVFSLTPKRYASFLKTAFGYYYDDFKSGKYISVREFDNFVMLAQGRMAECCGMNGVCPANLVIEADGGAYPCDFYVLDEWKCGNIIDNSVEEIFSSDNAKKFRERSYETDEKCRRCRYYVLCRGGCARYRGVDESGKLLRQKYCESYIEFFDSCADKIAELARIANQRNI